MKGETEACPECEGGQDMKSPAVASWQQERRESKQSPIDPLIANSHGGALHFYFVRTGL